MAKQYFDEESEFGFKEFAEQLRRLGRDLKKAIGDFRLAHAQVLVTYYYLLQENRIRAFAQKRETEMLATPNEFIDGLAQSQQISENVVKSALGAFADTYKIGKWCQAQHGVGPVLTTACLTFFDIRKAPTVGHYYSFAGLNPDRVWLGKEKGEDAVQEAKRLFEKDNGNDMEWLNHIVRVSGQRPDKVLEAYRDGVILRTKGWAALSTFLGKKEAEATLKEAKKLFKGFHDPDISWLTHICQESGHTPDVILDTFQNGVVKKKVGWEGVKFLLTRIPYNKELKMIMLGRLGDSFVRTWKSPKSFYGALYAKKKAELTEANEKKAFAEDAAKQLREKRIRKNTECYKALSEGMLPKDQIHKRARRWAVKLFLSHFHELVYAEYHGRPAPAPFIFAHPVDGKEHGHKIEPPLWPGNYEGKSVRELYR